MQGQKGRAACSLQGRSRPTAALLLATPVCCASRCLRPQPAAWGGGARASSWCVSGWVCSQSLSIPFFLQDPGPQIGQLYLCSPLHLQGRPSPSGGWVDHANRRQGRALQVTVLVKMESTPARLPVRQSGYWAVLGVRLCAAWKPGGTRYWGSKQPEQFYTSVPRVVHPDYRTLQGTKKGGTPDTRSSTVNFNCITLKERSQTQNAVWSVYM